MHRFTYALALLALVGWSGLTWAADAKVEFKDDKGKPASLDGTIDEESPAGIKIKGKLVPVSDIIRVTYAPPPALKIDNTMLKATEAEEAGKHPEALKLYEATLMQLTGDPWKPLRRHVDFRMATTKIAMAEANPGEANANLKAALDPLEKFIKDNPTAWQVVSAGKLLGKMQLALGQTDKAAKTFDDLTKLNGVEGAAKTELMSLNIDALMSANKAADAEKKVAELDRAIPAGDPRKPRIRVYQVACKLSGTKQDANIAELNQIIKTSNDASVLALAYNTLGDCYRSSNDLEMARWQYLFVDVVHNGDRAEHAKACERLAEVFKGLNDDQRSEEYKAKAQRLR